MASILEKALGKEMVLPARKISTVEELLEVFPDVRDLLIDGTERSIQRPKDDEKQKENYSGKKKMHTRKNIIISDKKKLPTIGANGFLVRRELLEKCSIEDYLFDIDVVYELVMQGHDKFAKVKTGIIHIFSGSMSTFIKKQRRRIKDCRYYEKLGIRKYPWSSLSNGKLLKFVIYVLAVFPLVRQTMRDWMQKRDNAWSFHIFACWATLIIYFTGTLKNRYNPKAKVRTKWSCD